MKKQFLILAFSWVCFYTQAQNHDEIKQLLTRQQNHWNKGDIENFMEDYWKSDNLKFIGKNGVVKGWKATKERYLKTYPDKATMGTLKFDIIEIDQLDAKTSWLVGKWQLFRPEKGDTGGFFTLLLKKIKGRWYIVADHTS